MNEVHLLLSMQLGAACRVLLLLLLLLLPFAAARYYQPAALGAPQRGPSPASTNAASVHIREGNWTACAA